MVRLISTAVKPGSIATMLDDTINSKKNNTCVRELNLFILINEMLLGEYLVIIYYLRL